MDISDLQRAKLCSVSTLGRAQVGLSGNLASNWTFNMSNDGGWCWRGSPAQLGSTLYAPTFRITSSPAHGELRMGEATKNLTRIAYKPAPGFIGVDTFTLTESVTAWQIIATITVTQ